VNYTLTLQHYRDFLTAGLPVFLYSLRVSAISAVPALLLGFLVAYLVSRQRFFGRRFIEIGSLLSFATPGTVMGVAYVFAFNTGPWLLTASMVIIVLALVFRNMPVAIRAAVSGLAQIDPSLEEASTMLRARTFTTLRRVLFPLLINTLITGLIYAFVSGVTAVSQVIFLVSPGNQLATVLMLGWIEQGQLGRGAAMGTVLIISMLLRYGRTLEPPARISSVEMLSPILRMTGTSKLSSIGSKSGIFEIFGPFLISTLWLSSGGASSISSPFSGIAGSSISGYGISSVLGSVMTPVKAEAAAVSGLHRKTLSSLVPERPGKFLGVVRRLFWPEAGACPMPMHPLQPAWWRRPDADRRFAICPFSTSCWSCCLDVGLMSNEMPFATCLPSTILLAIAKSR